MCCEDFSCMVYNWMQKSIILKKMYKCQQPLAGTWSYMEFMGNITVQILKINEHVISHLFTLDLLLLWYLFVQLHVMFLI